MNETTYSPYGDSPGLVKTIGIITLISGIANIFWGLAATAIVVPTIILACLAIFTILPTILGVFEIIYALKLLNNPPQPVQPSTTIAILEILTVLTGNVFSMIVGILSLVFYNDPQVKEYFAKLNGIPYPVAPEAPAPPAPPATPEPASPQDETPEAESESPEEETAPEVPKSPEPKKPRKRKVAAEKSDADSETESEPKSE
ncbi:MAG: hypothetical protein PVJ21_16285 [Anaerolineales bacterium]|jgi:hypothetical protein